MPPKRIPATNEEGLPTNRLSGLSADGKRIVAYMRKEFERMTDLLTSKSKEIDDLKNEVFNLKELVSKLDNSIDDADAYERRDTIVFSGDQIPEVSQGENCANIIQDIIKNKLRIELPLREINTAHRMGRKPQNQTEDKRAIIVKLCRREMKRDIMSANRLKIPGLYINESLTPKRRTIFFTLRQMKKAHRDIITGCTTFDGKVYAFTKQPAGTSSNLLRPRDTRHLVNTQEALTKFCRDYIKQPLETFLATWPY